MLTEQPRNPHILKIEARLEIFEKGNVVLDSPREAREYAHKMNLEIDIAHADQLISLLEATQYKLRVRDALYEYIKILSEV